jgi:hypothetical protein
MYNMKKQVLAILLALIMVLVPSTAAFAAAPGGGGQPSIDKFVLDGVTGDIDQVNGIINVTIPFDTDVSDIAPTTLDFSGGDITVAVANSDVDDYETGHVYVDDDKAKGFAKQNFTVDEDYPVVYTVDGAGGKMDYAVAIEYGPASATKSITNFVLAGVPAKITDNTDTTSGNETVQRGTITVTVPYDTTGNLTPTNFRFTGKTIRVKGVEDAGVSDAVTVKTGNDIVTGMARNFFNADSPIVYVVTDQKGDKKEYTVKATIAKASSVARIDKFTLTNKAGKVFDGTVDEANSRIIVTVPYSQSKELDDTGLNVTESLTAAGLPKSGLYAKIEWTGKKTAPVKSGANKFDNDGDVKYTVTAENNNTTAYDVYVRVAAAGTGNRIERFYIEDADENVIAEAVITEGVKNILDVLQPGTITLALPYYVDITKITPVIKTSDNGAATVQWYNGSSYVDLPVTSYTSSVYSPIRFLVTAENNVANTNSYNVTVTSSAAKSTNEITSFVIAGNEGVIDNEAGTIEVEVPYGTSLSQIPVITHTGKKDNADDDTGISPKVGASQNFASPVTYLVYAETGAIKSYKVTVTVAEPTATNEITSFTLAGATGTIGDGTVTVEVPFGTALTALTPVITHNGASISPNGAQDFSSTVAYAVTAQNGTVKTYTVTATVGKEPAPSDTEKNGWEKQADGTWKYFVSDKAVANNWKKVNGYWYYFGSNGIMKSGWQKIDGSWYYLSSPASGKMVASKWFKDTDGKWYYLSASGAMVTGKKTIGGKAYSFNGSGVWIG